MTGPTITLAAGDVVSITGAQPLSVAQADPEHLVVTCAAVPPTPPPPPPPPPSGFAFMDSFGSTRPSVGRADGLGVVWGASRLSGNQGFAGPANGWVGSTTSDITLPGGVLVDTVTDGGTVTCLAMYPKQPFDFAGRTGKIVFDVGNDTAGNHAAWPELWVTDTPVPAPFAHEETMISLPRHGFGIRFAGATDANGNGATPTRGQGAVGVDSAIVVNDYVKNDSFSGGSLKVIGIDSVLKATAGHLNHYEVDVSATQIDVYGTDPYPVGQPNPNPLRHLATIPCALSLTRGLVWIEDVHYNGNKFSPPQGTHSFTWDNVGFDGPVLPKDLGFDVLDAPGGSATGYNVPGNSQVALKTTAMTAANIAAAAKCLLVLNFYHQVAPLTLAITVNGVEVDVPWPYPDNVTFTPRTLDVTVPLTALVPGINTIAFRTGNYAINIANVSLILAGAGG